MALYGGCVAGRNPERLVLSLVLSLCQCLIIPRKGSEYGLLNDLSICAFWCEDVGALSERQVWEMIWRGACRRVDL